MYRVSPFVRHFAWAVLGGAALATAWVNLAPASYYDAIEWRLFDLPRWAAFGDALVVATPIRLVSEGLMALFFAFLGKELWEALALERAPAAPRAALLPLGLLFGAMAGGVLLWLSLSAGIETAEEAGFGTGWAVPLSGDVVLAYVIGRRVFGPGHPALHLLLLVGIGADILAMLALGLAGPEAALRPVWLLLPLGASLGVYAVWGRRPPPGANERQKRRLLVLWPYAVAGAASWAGVVAAGLPGALGLLPVVPAIAHADRTFGLFAEAESFLHDPLNRLARLLVKPLIAVLFLFGLTRGGVDLRGFAPTTLVVLGAFWIGRPLGALLGGWVAVRLFGAPLPRGVTARDLLLIAVIFGIGFTVPVLSLDAALPGGAMQEAARLGLAVTLLAGPLALLLAPRLPR